MMSNELYPHQVEKLGTDTPYHRLDFYVNHKDDVGKGTLFGVSVVFHPIVYRRLWKAEFMWEVRIILRDFYKSYWNPLFNKIDDPKLAIRIFDLGVNMGKRTIIKHLQRTLNGVNWLRKVKKFVIVDGKYGRKTHQKTNTTLRNFPAYFDIRFYQQILDYYQTRKKWYVFGKGWKRRLERKIMLGTNRLNKKIEI